MTIHNFACPHCAAVNRDKLVKLSEDINKMLLAEGIINSYCGSASLAASILGAMLAHKRMEVRNPDLMRTSLKDLLTELDELSTQLVKVELAELQAQTQPPKGH